MKLLLLITLALAAQDTYEVHAVPSFSAWRATQPHFNKFSHCETKTKRQPFTDCFSVVEMKCYGITKQRPTFTSYATRLSCTDKVEIKAANESYEDILGVTHDYSREFMEEAYRAWLFFYQAEDLVAFRDSSFKVIHQEKVRVCNAFGYGHPFCELERNVAPKREPSASDFFAVAMGFVVLVAFVVFIVTLTCEGSTPTPVSHESALPKIRRCKDCGVECKNCDLKRKETHPAKRSAEGARDSGNPHTPLQFQRAPHDTCQCEYCVSKRKRRELRKAEHDQALQVQ